MQKKSQNASSEASSTNNLPKLAYQEVIHQLVNSKLMTLRELLAASTLDSEEFLSIFNMVIDFHIELSPQHIDELDQLFLSFISVQTDEDSTTRIITNYAEKKDFNKNSELFDQLYLIFSNRLFHANKESSVYSCEEAYDILLVLLNNNKDHTSTYAHQTLENINQQLSNSKKNPEIMRIYFDLFSALCEMNCTQPFNTLKDCIAIQFIHFFYSAPDQLVNINLAVFKNPQWAPSVSLIKVLSEYRSSGKLLGYRNRATNRQLGRIKLLDLFIFLMASASASKETKGYTMLLSNRLSLKEHEFLVAHHETLAPYIQIQDDERYQPEFFEKLLTLIPDPTLCCAVLQVHYRYSDQAKQAILQYILNTELTPATLTQLLQTLVNETLPAAVSGDERLHQRLLVLSDHSDEPDLAEAALLMALKFTTENAEAINHLFVKIESEDNATKKIELLLNLGLIQKKPKQIIRHNNPRPYHQILIEIAENILSSKKSEEDFTGTLTRRLLGILIDCYDTEDQYHLTFFEFLVATYKNNFTLTQAYDIFNGAEEPYDEFTPLLIRFCKKLNTAKQAELLPIITTCLQSKSDIENHLALQFIKTFGNSIFQDYYLSFPEEIDTIIFRLFELSEGDHAGEDAIDLLCHMPLPIQDKKYDEYYEDLIKEIYHNMLCNQSLSHQLEKSLLSYLNLSTSTLSRITCASIITAYLSEPYEANRRLGYFNIDAVLSLRLSRMKNSAANELKNLIPILQTLAGDQDLNLFTITKLIVCSFHHLDSDQQQSMLKKWANLSSKNPFYMRLTQHLLNELNAFEDNNTLQAYNLVCSIFSHDQSEDLAKEECYRVCHVDNHLYLFENFLLGTPFSGHWRESQQCLASRIETDGRAILGAIFLSADQTLSMWAPTHQSAPNFEEIEKPSDSDFVCMLMDKTIQPSATMLCQWLEGASINTIAPAIMTANEVRLNRMRDVLDQLSLYKNEAIQEKLIQLMLLTYKIERNSLAEALIYKACSHQDKAKKRAYPIAKAQHFKNDQANLIALIDYLLVTTEYARECYDFAEDEEMSDELVKNYDFDRVVVHYLIQSIPLLTRPMIEKILEHLFDMITGSDEVQMYVSYANQILFALLHLIGREHHCLIDLLVADLNTFYRRYNAGEYSDNSVMKKTVYDLFVPVLNSLLPYSPFLDKLYTFLDKLHTSFHERCIKGGEYDLITETDVVLYNSYEYEYSKYEELICWTSKAFSSNQHNTFYFSKHNQLSFEEKCQEVLASSQDERAEHLRSRNISSSTEKIIDTAMSTLQQSRATHTRLPTAATLNMSLDQMVTTQTPSINQCIESFRASSFRSSDLVLLFKNRDIFNFLLPFIDDQDIIRLASLNRELRLTIQKYMPARLATQIKPLSEPRLSQYFWKRGFICNCGSIFSEKAQIFENNFNRDTPYCKKMSFEEELELFEAVVSHNQKIAL